MWVANKGNCNFIKVTATVDNTIDFFWVEFVSQFLEEKSEVWNINLQLWEKKSTQFNIVRYTELTFLSFFILRQKQSFHRLLTNIPKSPQRKVLSEEE